MKRLIILMFCLLPAFSYAGEAKDLAADPVLEKRMIGLAENLRCLVCQNESIDESDADLAHDLRVLVRQRLVAGDSDEQVKAYLVARYGNYVLLKPPFLAETYLLWIGPALLLMAAAGIALLYYRRSAAQAAPAPLSPEEQRRIANLMDQGMSGPKDT
jgi:cytochrome c-type biogenesis protein CcmH